MRLPKKINILHKTFEIKRSDKIFGGFHFQDEDNDNKPTITLTSSKDRSAVLEVLMHEVLEITTELLRVRYESPDAEESYEFHYKHKEHDTICKVLSQVLQQVFKESV